MCGQRSRKTDERVRVRMLKDFDEPGVYTVDGRYDGSVEPFGHRRLCESGGRRQKRDRD
jgi:hypothetical protein